MSKVYGEVDLADGIMTIGEETDAGAQIYLTHKPTYRFEQVNEYDSQHHDNSKRDVEKSVWTDNNDVEDSVSVTLSASVDRMVKALKSGTHMLLFQASGWELMNLVKEPDWAWPDDVFSVIPRRDMGEFINARRQLYLSLEASEVYRLAEMITFRGMDIDDYSPIFGKKYYAVDLDEYVGLLRQAQSRGIWWLQDYVRHKLRQGRKNE